MAVVPRDLRLRRPNLVVVKKVARPIGLFLPPVRVADVVALNFGNAIRKCLLVGVVGRRLLAIG